MGSISIQFTLLLLLNSVAASLAAQTPTQRLRGTVHGESGFPVRGATVVITRAPDRLTLAGVTDSAGVFAISFDSGTGDYLVHVTAGGWKPHRERVTAAPGDSVISVRVVLRSDAVAVAGLSVRAGDFRPQRGPPPGTEPAAAEKFVDGVAATLPPDLVGDLTAMAATIPGVTVASDNPSAFGLVGQANTTLNGVSFPGSSIPRDARVRTRVSTSTYDPSRGGFSSLQTAVELAPGGEYSSVRAHGWADAPVLQFGAGAPGRTARGYQSTQASVGADGLLSDHKLYYNYGLQISRRTSPTTSVLDPDGTLAERFGVPADSVARFTNILDRAGIPVSNGGLGRRTVAESGSLIGRLDHTPSQDATRSWGLLWYANLQRSTGLSIRPTAAPTLSNRRSSGLAQIQGVYSTFSRSNRLNETRTALTYSFLRTGSQLALPEGRVLLQSPADPASPPTSLAFGGSGGLDSRSRSVAWETLNETQWFSAGGAHKPKLYLQSRFESFWRSSAVSPHGTFVFGSLAELEANRPLSFFRTLNAPQARGGEWSGAAALGDSWRVSERFQVLVGLRAETNYFTSRPRYNPLVESVFGVRNDRMPNDVHLSPRAGFSWRIGSSTGPEAGMAASPMGTRFSGPTGVLRGGIGEFRSVPAPTDVLSTLTGTGLPGSTRQLLCVGTAVPTPDWPGYLDGAPAPTQCLGTPTIFGDTAASVAMLSSEFSAPRSWRASLGWVSNLGKVGFSIDADYSWNLNQRGTYDLNFAGVQRFELADAGARPVFVEATQIDTATGFVSPIGARRSAAFARATEIRSDLRSVGRQLTLTVNPTSGFDRYFLSLAYTLADARAQTRGFDGVGSDDPRRREWVRSDADVRHQLQLQAGVNSSNRFAFTLFARVNSGLPFTPMVSSDINGDGYANDPAFIPDNLGSANPSPAFSELLRSAPGYARACLSSQAGRVARKNSCRGPWTASLNARLDLQNRLHHLGQRVNIALNLSNPLGAIDRVLHGQSDYRGWGVPATPDPVLYVVNGFDPASRAFSYKVNPRFGRSWGDRSPLQESFRITLDIRVDLSRPVPVQQLERVLNPGRNGHRGVRLSQEQLRERYSRTVPDPYALVLAESDSLLLTTAQAQALRSAQLAYRARMNSVWTELATRFASLPDRFDAALQLQAQKEATDRAWQINREDGARIQNILSRVQFQMLSGVAQYLLRGNRITVRQIR